MTALHGTSMEHTSTVYMLGGFVLYVKMPEPTTPLTISDPRGGLVATKWGKVLVNGWQLFQVKIVCWDLRNERFFFMFHLKKRRSEFLFFVSISLQVQHRSCNLHAVFLGLEGRRTNTFGIWFWRFQQSQVVKKSILPKLSHWHYHWYFLSDCFSKTRFFFLKGSHGKKVNLFANKRTQKSQEGGLEVIRCTDAPNPAPLDRISVWRIPAIHSMIH